MEPAVTRRDSRTAVMLVVVVGFLMQSGSTLAVMVIDAVGVVQTLWLRTALAAIILALIRPGWLRPPPRGHRLAVLGLTLSLVAMNFCFYEAISRIPVGIAVAVEFLGPLGVAIVGSRRLLDVAWAVAAGAGVFLLARPGGSVTVTGLVFALLAALCWAAFILSAKRTVRAVEPMRATLYMLVGASVILTPIWLIDGVQVVGQSRALLLGLGVALLSSALPYLLELLAISKVRAATYGVLLSIEPAIGALMGFLILSQRLGWREMLGILGVMVAAAGASWFGASSQPRRRRTVPDT